VKTLDNREIIDITPLISKDIAVFPGDTRFSRTELLSFDKGHNLVLSSVETTVHLGAHTDAPSHYHKDGRTIEKQSLNTYMGKAQVIEINANSGERINLTHLKNEKIQAPRVLFKTNSFPDPNKWNDDFNSLSGEVIDHLNKQKVILIGIDTPSVDPADDKELISHNKIYNYGLAILEGIVLKDVSPGLYDLVALPLPIQGCDASPVRAVLLK
jgi:arylformamidase